MLICSWPAARELTSPRYRHPRRGIRPERRSSDCSYAPPLQDCACRVTALVVAPQRRNTNMNSRLILTGSLVAAAFIAAACSTTTSSAGPYGAAPAPSAAPSAAPIVAPSAPAAAPVASGTAINLPRTTLAHAPAHPTRPPAYPSLADTHPTPI